MRLFLFPLVLMLAACSKQELNKPFVAKTTNVIDTEIQRDATDSAGLESARLNIWFDEQYASARCDILFPLNRPFPSQKYDKMEGFDCF